MTLKKCTRCKWHETETGINCTGMFGNKNAELMLVGESFGKTESIKKTAFVGASGKILTQMLDSINMTMDEVAIINAMRCYKDDGAKPTKKELDKCFLHTLRDVQQVKPKLVVAMGAIAFYQVSGKAKEDYGFYRGKLIYSDKIGCDVYTTYHPAAVLYDVKKKDTLLQQFANIPTIFQLGVSDVYNYDYEVIDTQELFDGVLQRFEVAPEIFFDIESTGLSSYYNELTLIQMSDGQTPICLFTPEIVKDNSWLFKEWFEHKPVSGQTFDFDSKFMFQKYDIFPEIWDHDCCLAEYIISGMYGNDLSTLTWKYCPESGGYDEYVKLLGGAHMVKDPKVLQQYGGNDVGVMHKIKDKQIQMLKQMGKYDLFKNFVMPTNKVLTKMSIRGIKYDMNRLYELDEYYVNKSERAMFKALVLPGIHETEVAFNKKFNPSSSDHVKHLLLNYYKLPVLAKTKNDNPSVSISEMEKYAAEPYDNDYCKIMVKYRSYNTLRKNFLSGVVDKLIDDTAHTTYSIHATETGRPNSKGPNLLNVPSSTKSCLVARDGHKFVSADEGQLEIRIASVIYDEPKLIEICNSDRDMHSQITAQIFDHTYEYIQEGYEAGVEEIVNLRKRGKTIQFSILYQTSPRSLAYELGITEEEAAEFIKQYFLRFPDMYKNINKTKDLVKKQWFLDSYFGFRRRWEAPVKPSIERYSDSPVKLEEAERKYRMIVNKIQREAVNMKIQSPAFSLIELALIQIDERLEKEKLESRLVEQVYDSVVVESPNDEIDDVSDIVQEIMENVNKPYPNLNRVKLVSDIEVGPDMENLTRRVKKNGVWV